MSIENIAARIDEARKLRIIKSEDIDVEKLARELHGELSNRDENDDEDPFAEGNYIRRA